MKNAIWFEKYRPTSLEEMVLDKNYLETFEAYLDDGEIPHLLFHGPAGSGKTTLAGILISEIASNSLNLNASSSDRGIAVIKTTVKTFASSKPREKDKLNIVFFDEADGLTADAQNALRNTMEKFHSTCRFIFTCNNIDRIIEPIISRCQVYHFESLPERKIEIMCKGILRKEKIRFRPDTLKDIVERYHPDVRSTINNLQACSTTGKLNNNYLDKFDPDNFILFLDNGRIHLLRELWANTRDFTRLYSFLFNQYAATIKDNDLRADLMITIAEYLYKDRTVADREINFTACVLDIMTAMDLKIDFTGTKKR